MILGGGTAGTMAANRLYKELDKGQWGITVVDADDDHRYQPGYLFMPFGTYKPSQVTKSRRATLHTGVDLQYGEIDVVRPEEQTVALTDGREFAYDFLIIATGVSPRPDQTDGMLGPLWRESVHEFYSYEGSVTLAQKLKDWPGGRLVVNIVDMPIKCPVAPLEFAFLALTLGVFFVLRRREAGLFQTTHYRPAQDRPDPSVANAARHAGAAAASTRGYP